MVLLVGEILLQQRSINEKQQLILSVRGGPTATRHFYKMKRLFIHMQMMVNRFMFAVQISLICSKWCKDGATIVVEPKFSKIQVMKIKRWNIIIEIPIITMAQRGSCLIVITQSILALAIANYFTGETIPKEVLRTTMLLKIPSNFNDMNNKCFMI